MGKPIVLGESAESGERVTLSPEDRRLHTYIVGASGMGKTTLLVNIAVTDMENGDGLCFLDPHGGAVDELLKMVPEKRLDDVILWDPLDIERPFGLNLFECEDPTNPVLRDRVSDLFITTFKRIFPEAFASGPRMEELMRSLALTFVENPRYTLAETARFLRDKDYRQQLLPQLTNPYLRHEYWPYFDLRTIREQHEIVSSSLNKLGRFLGNTLIRNIFGQPTSSLAFGKLMNQRKILLVRLPVGQIGEENAELLGSIIVGRLLDAAFSRGTDSNLPQFHLIVDEFQRFATSAFPTLQAEARKFNIDTVFAHQFLAQLIDEVMRDSALTVENKVIFRVNGVDAGVLATHFDNTPPPPLVIGERSQTTLVYDPLKHLEQHGHTDTRVQEAFSGLNMVLLEKERLIQQERDFKHDVGIAVTYPQLARVETKLANARERARQYLYARMLDDDKDEINEFMIDYKLGTAVTYLSYYEPVGVHWTAKTDGFLEEKSEHLGRAYKPRLKELGDLLAENPVMSQSGQYEPIYDKPIPYIEVERERANKLTILPRFTAECTLSQDGQRVEHTIKTLPQPQIPKDGHERARQIRERSRNVCGRDRKKVEEEIGRRLQIRAPGYDESEVDFREKV